MEDINYREMSYYEKVDLCDELYEKFEKYKFLNYDTKSYELREDAPEEAFKVLKSTEKL